MSDSEQLQVWGMLSTWVLWLGGCETPGVKRCWLNKTRATLSTSILSTTHSARHSDQCCPDYPVQRPMQCGILCWNDSVQMLAGYPCAKQEDGQVFQPKPLILERAFVKHIREWACGGLSTRTNHCFAYFSYCVSSSSQSLIGRTESLPNLDSRLLTSLLWQPLQSITYRSHNVIVSPTV